MKSLKKNKKPVATFVKDVNKLKTLPVSGQHAKLVLNEYPFDLQLLTISRLYRKSRQFYNSLGGTFSPKVCSTMRALSAQDLFKDEIEFTPAFSELLWFAAHASVLPDAEIELQALKHFNDISLFHEQNHRVLWRFLPPAPVEQRDLGRYLNFAESLVVTLDLALGDEIGKELSLTFERLNLLYRPGVRNPWLAKSKKEYRRYMLGLLAATYFTLEGVDGRDCLKAVNYVLPGQKSINRAAVQRGLELNEHFTKVTNPNWQQLYWKSAALKLQKLHLKSEEEALYLPEDPLDLNEEFFYARRIFDSYGL